MKKHVSLFLVLLIIFSVLFAFPVEAAQPEQIQAEQTYASIRKDSIHNQVSAPRVTDLDVPNNCTVNAVGTGNEITAACSHTYRYSKTSGSAHKRVCTKCGYTTYESHSFNISTYSDAKHKKVCSKCSYTCLENHTLKREYRVLGLSQYEFVWCTKCDYTKFNKIAGLLYVPSCLCKK